MRSALFWPTPETAYHRDEFITLMPAKLRDKVEGAYRSGYEREEARRKKTASPTGFIPDPIEFPNGALLDVGVAEQKGDTDRVAAAYWAVVESATRAERWTRGWQMALAWLIPCVVLYALGWAVAWVRRGFARA